MKFFAFVMMIILFAQSVMPCADAGCADSKSKSAIITAASSHQTNNADEDNCAPLCSCACTHNFIGHNIHSIATPVVAGCKKEYSSYYLSPTSAYHAQLFQPPRFG